MKRLSDMLAPHKCYRYASKDLWRPGADKGNIDIYMEGLVSLLKNREIKPVVAGWSLGGMIALQTAIRFPDLIPSLVLIGCTSKFCSDPDYPHGVPAGQVRAMARGIKYNRLFTIQRFIEQARLPDSKVARFEPDKDMNLDEFNPEELSYGLHYLIKADFRRDLKNIRIPILLLHGEADAIIPRQASEFMHEALPMSSLRIYKKAGHSLPIFQHKNIADHILSFHNPRE